MNVRIFICGILVIGFINIIWMVICCVLWGGICVIDVGSLKLIPMSTRLSRNNLWVACYFKDFVLDE